LAVAGDPAFVQGNREISRMCKNMFKPSMTQARIQAAQMEASLAQQRQVMEQQLQATKAATDEQRRQFEEQQKQAALRAAEDLHKQKTLEAQDAASSAAGMVGMRSLLGGRRGGGGFSARSMLGVGQ
jgi:multidrug efflux pump subunit AcrA (membrane-fusion protein)